jgi:PAS domain S-box-containing protein
MHNNFSWQNGSYELLLTVLNTLDALVYAVDLSTYEILYMNQTAKNIWGDLVGDVCWRILGNGSSPCPDCANQKMFESPDTSGADVVREYQDPNGKWYSCRDRSMRWIDGRSVRLGIATDISERKAMEEALRESEERYRQLVEWSPAAILVEEKEKIITANKEALRLLGNLEFEDIIGKSLSTVLPSACYTQFRTYVQQSMNDSEPIECEIIRRDGSAVTVELNAAAFSSSDHQSIRIILWDLTEQKKKEEEYIQATKLESIGLLAGGIAHDFNNILTIISGYLSISRLYAKDSESLQDKLSEIENAVEQAVGLTQQLLTFAKGGAPVKKVISVSGLVNDAVRFALSGSNVRWLVWVSDDLCCVEVDEGQLSQVVNNLVINADQAMPYGGTVNIELNNVSVSAGNPLHLKPGKYVMITINDEGQGIHEKDLPKIFDPYFTTKSAGSGLGLATCYSIIKRHGGHIAVTSSYGKGSIFSVYLPATACVTEQIGERFYP